MSGSDTNKHTWVSGLTVGANIVPGNPLYQILKRALIARLLSFAHCCCHVENNAMLNTQKTPGNADDAKVRTDAMRMSITRNCQKEETGLVYGTGL